MIAVIDHVEVDPLMHLLLIRISGPEPCTIQALLPGTTVLKTWSAPYFGLMQAAGVDHAGKSVLAAVQELRGKTGITVDIPEWILLATPRQN